MQLRRTCLHLPEVNTSRFGDICHLRLTRWQELVEWGIQQPDRHRQTLHDSEKLNKVVPLHLQEFR